MNLRVPTAEGWVRSQGPLHVRSVDGKVPLGQVSLLVFRSSPDTIIPPMLRTCLHTILIRRTSGRMLGTFKQSNALSDIGWQWIGCTIAWSEFRELTVLWRHANCRNYWSCIARRCCLQNCSSRLVVTCEAPSSGDREGSWPHVTIHYKPLCGYKIGSCRTQNKVP